MTKGSFLQTPSLPAKSRTKREDTWGGRESRSGGARWARTVGEVAPVRGVALPKKPLAVGTPALDGRVILRRGATKDH